MNKKIIVSLSVIGLVAAIAIGGTIAYFSDTETSTGNLFAAGAIDLKIDNHCFYNGDECVWDEELGGYLWAGTGEPCFCTWELTDLDGEVFFDFEDMKPGDWGEDTVSLHVYSNDAWVCIDFEDVASEDNTCTEPESVDECGGTPDCCDADGELAENLYFKFWVDKCDGVWENPATGEPVMVEKGDDIFQPECDEYLVTGYADDVFSYGPYILADSSYSIFGEGPLTGNETYYIGKVWCFGELGAEMGPYGHIWTCDGQYVYNESQTDSLEGDIIFYAEQARNNDNFSCFGL